MANNFTGDTGCQAVYNFESGALTTDSSPAAGGNGANTLTLIGSPAADTTNYKEGSASIALVAASNQYAYIPDSSLSANFPLKTGDATKKISVACWFRLNSLPASNFYTIWAKGRDASYNYGLQLRVNTAGQLNLIWGWGTSNGNYYNYLPVSGLVTSTWYHLTVVLDGTNKNYQVYLWNDSTKALTGVYSAAPANVLSVLDADFQIGRSGKYSTEDNYNFDGDIDEVVVFNRLLHYTEANAIRVGNFPVSNNFANDATCLALYNFESGALTTDSKGSNTLTASASAPTADTTNFMQGAGSAAMVRASSQYELITDANLPSTWPFKNGTSNTKATFVGWFRFNSVTAVNQGLMGKGLEASGGAGIYEYNGTLYFAKDATWQSTGITVGTGNWYHIAVTIDSSTNTFYARVYNTQTATVSTYTYSWGTSLTFAANDFRIGCFNDGTSSLDGNADEVVIFNRLLGDHEIDAIRNGTFNTNYTPPTNSLFADAQFAQVEYLETPEICADATFAQVEYIPTPPAISSLDLSGDSSCVAAWRFESGALGADSKGTNTLTVNGGTAYTDLFKEGSSSLYLAGLASEYLSIADANLAAGFPLKNGDATQVVTFNFWVNSWAATNQYLFDKSGCGLYVSSVNRLYVYWPYSGGTQTIDTGLNNDFGTQQQWINITVVIDGVNKDLRVWAYTAATQSFTLIYSATPTNTLLVGSGALTIGCKNDTTLPFKGLIDQFLVFNRKLSYFDVYRIISRSYNGARGTNVFTGNTNLKAQWLFNSAGITTDSSGNNNTLTDASSTPATYPNNIEGNQQAFTTPYGGTFYLSIADANLSAGFPLKNGDATKQFSCTFFCNPVQITGMIKAGFLFNKQVNSSDNNVIGLYLTGGSSSPGQLQVYWGDGSSRNVYNTGIYLNMGWQYHIGMVVDGVNKTIYLRVYEYLTATTYTYSYSPANALGTNSGAFAIGGVTAPAGAYVDEFEVFNKLLIPLEIDDIRLGQYTYMGGTGAATLAKLTAPSIGGVVGSTGSGSSGNMKWWADGAPIFESVVDTSGMNFWGDGAPLIQSLAFSTGFTHWAEAQPVWRDTGLVTSDLKYWGDGTPVNIISGQVDNFAPLSATLTKLTAAVAGSASEAPRSGTIAGVLTPLTSSVSGWTPESRTQQTSGGFVLGGAAANSGWYVDVGTLAATIGTIPSWLFTEDCESFDVNNWNGRNDVTNSTAVSGISGFSGKCLDFNTSTWRWLQKNISTSSEVYLSWKVKPLNGCTGLMIMWGSGDAATTITRNASTGILSAAYPSPGATTYATGTHAVADNAVATIKLYFKPSTTSNGRFKLWINDVLDIDFTGVTSTQSNVDCIQFGTGSWFYIFQYVDEVKINTTQPAGWPSLTPTVISADIAGTFTANISYTQTSTGGFVLGGAADNTHQYVQAAVQQTHGGLVLGGSAPTEQYGLDIGTVGATPSKITASGDGVVLVEGSVGADVAVTMHADGARGETIGGAATIHQLTASGAGYAPIHGDLSASLRRITASGSIGFNYAAFAAKLKKITASGSGTFTITNFSGTVAANLKKITASIQGGGAGVNLQKITASGSGLIIVQGYGAATTKKITASAAGARGVSGQVAGTMEDIWASNITAGRAHAKTTPLTGDIEGRFGSDFSHDATAVALWRFEPGALTFDSIGNNTLTNSNATSSSDAAEGNGSAYLDGTAHFSIEDRDLPVGFPLKSTDTSQRVTYQAWIKFTDLPLFANHTVFSKFNWTDGECTFALHYDQFPGYWHLLWGYDSGQHVQDLLFYNIPGPVVGQWYHIQLVIDGLNSMAHFELWDPSSQHFFTHVCTAETPPIINPGLLPLHLSAADFCIGSKADGADPFIGEIDEAMVFNGLFNSWDHAKIVSHAYTGPRGDNNFTGDTRLYGNYRFSDPLGQNDSSGRHNNLTLHENINYEPTYGYPWAVEGATAGYPTSYAGGSGWSRADSQLTSGFPLKSTDVSKRMTFCCFFMPDRVTGLIRGGYIFSKGHTQGYPDDTGLSLILNTGWDPPYPDYPDFVPELIIEWTDIYHDKQVFHTGITLHWLHWYHLALIVDGKAKTIKLEVYDAHNNGVTTFTATADAELKVDTGDFWLGGFWMGAVGAQGMMDEALVFNALLNDTELQEIRDGDYTTGQQAVSGADLNPITADISGATVVGTLHVTLSKLLASITAAEGVQGTLHAGFGDRVCSATGWIDVVDYAGDIHIILDPITAQGRGSWHTAVSFDLILEVSQRDKRDELKEAEKLGAAVIREPDTPIAALVPAKTAPSIEETSPSQAVENLTNDATFLQQRVDDIINLLKKVCDGVQYQVPQGDTVTRSALLSMGMNQDIVTYQNYLDALYLQVGIAQHASNNSTDQINEALMNASGQANVITEFYDKNLTTTISDPAVWAMQTKNLIDAQNTGSAINSFLNTYAVDPTSANNAIVEAMGGQGQTTLGKILAECIPCLQRTLSMNGFNPLQEIIGMLQGAITSRLAYLEGLWNMLTNGTNINICDLMNFLNTMCIPDLFALLASLSHYYLQLTNLHKINVWSILWSLVEPLLQGLLMGFSSLIDRFIRLIMAPVMCIEQSIDHEYAKLYNLGHMKWDEKQGLVVNPPYANNFSKWANDQINNKIFSPKSAIGSGLLELKKAINNSQGFLNAQVKRLRDAIAESLNMKGDALSNSQGLMQVLRWLSLVIGLIKALIKFKQDGFQCNKNNMTSPQQQVLMNYLTAATGSPFIFAPVDSAVTPTTTSDITNITEITNQLLTPPSSMSSTFDPKSTTSAASSAEVAAAAFIIPDCVSVQNEIKRAKVADWVTELNNLSS